MSIENKLAQERKEAGCNTVNCNYQFQPLNVKETEDGKTDIARAVLYCTFCTHTEECIFDQKILQELATEETEEEQDAIQEP